MSILNSLNSVTTSKASFVSELENLKSDLNAALSLVLEVEKVLSLLPDSAVSQVLTTAPVSTVSEVAPIVEPIGQTVTVQDAVNQAAPVVNLTPAVGTASKIQTVAKEVQVVSSELSQTPGVVGEVASVASVLAGIFSKK